MNMIRFIVALTVVFTSFAWAAEPPKLSKFIENPATLAPKSGMEGVWYWNKSGVKFKDYNKVLLADIEIFLAPDSEYDGINANQMKALSDSMRAVMIDALEPDYPMVSKPGSGVIVARIAITNVHLGKEKHQLGKYTPVGLLFGGAKKIAGKSKTNFSLKGASVEAEMFDAQSGERLAIRIDTKPLRSLKGKTKEMSWDAIEESLKVYGKRFREGVEKVHGM